MGAQIFALKKIMRYTKYINTAVMSVNVDTLLFVYVSCLYICQYTDGKCIDIISAIGENTCVGQLPCISLLLAYFRKKKKKKEKKKKSSGENVQEISNKRQKDYLWNQRTHYALENGSLSVIETLHKQ